MKKVSPKNIAEAIYKATEGKSGNDLVETIKHSAEILKHKRMLGKSEEILFTLQSIFEKSTGTIRMKVTTVKSMEGTERKKLEHEIKEKYKAEHVIGEFFEKEELLGGMRVEVGNEVLDNTYRNKLNQLEKFLIKEK